MELKLNLINEIVFRVVFESRENYRLATADRDELLPAEMSGSFRMHSPVRPTVGDYVRGRILSGAGGDWILIEEILPRKSEIKRQDSGGKEQVLAANVDYLFIVTSANHDLNFNRLDRYLALAQAASVEPVLVVNKIELSENAASILDALAERYSDIDVHAVSVMERVNLEFFDLYLQPAITVAFVGSSGVGKSSLTNYLVGSQCARTQDIREGDSRGRHTTTHRELQICANGAAVIDTPGLRSVGLTSDAEPDSLFADIESLARQCKFTDCSHANEPNCAVQKALQSGELAEDRWCSYHKMQKEVLFQKRKSDKALQSDEKKRWAKISKNIRQHYKQKR